MAMTKNKGQLFLYKNGVNPVSMDYCADVGDAYGDGHNYGYRFSGDPRPEYYYKYNLYDAHGNKTNYRIIRGLRRTIQDANKSRISLYQESIFYRYLRIMFAMIKAGKPIKDVGLIGRLHGVGVDFAVNLARIVSGECRFYRGTKRLYFSCRDYAEPGDDDYLDVPKLIWVKENGYVKFYPIKSVTKEMLSVVSRMVDAYEDSYIIVQSDERKLKERMGWKSFRPGGRQKYDAMNESLRAQCEQENGIRPHYY